MKELTPLVPGSLTLRTGQEGRGGLVPCSVWGTCSEGAGVHSVHVVHGFS